jgi:hypothetical protein
LDEQQPRRREKRLATADSDMLMEEDKNQSLLFYTMLPKVGIFFVKNLTGVANEISYETYSGSEQTAATLSIEELVILQGLSSDSRTHADSYFQGFKAQLVLFYGYHGGVLSKSSKFQGIDINYSDKRVFIHWKIDSISALESIANSLHRSKKLFVRVEILTSDETFDAAKNSQKLVVDVDTISLSFE